MISSSQLQDSQVLRACSFNLGAAYVEAGQPLSGLDHLHRAHPGSGAERLPDLQFNLALAHNALGQNQQAAQCFLQAAHLYRSQGNGSSEGDAWMEMSHCYSRSQVSKTRETTKKISTRRTTITAGSKTRSIIKTKNTTITRTTITTRSRIIAKTIILTKSRIKTRTRISNRTMLCSPEEAWCSQ